jgi:hypothetical protein
MFISIKTLKALTLLEDYIHRVVARRIYKYYMENLIEFTKLIRFKSNRILAYSIRL